MTRTAIILTSAFAALLAAGCAGATPRGTEAGGTEASGTVVDPTLLRDLGGVEHTIPHADRPTVLIFWATWCAPCRRELPALAKAHQAHSEDARFFGVLSGGEQDVDEELAAKLATAAGVSYPQLRDAGGVLARALKIQGTPTILVLGRDGEVIYRSHEEPDWSELLAR